jgi:hypothetical protein
MRIRINIELKLFISFLIIYSLFVHWIGSNDYSRLDLTKAMVDQKEFEIDSYINNTPDRAFFGGHYYSVKPPGSSILAIPAYATWKTIYNFLPYDITKNDSNSNETISWRAVNATISMPQHLSLFDSVTLMLLPILFGSVIGALSVVLFYKIIDKFPVSKNGKLLAVLSYGIGSLILPYSIVWFRENIATLLCLLLYYLISNFRGRRNIFFAGLLAGFIIVVDYPAAIISLFIIFLIKEKKRNLLPYLIGGAIGVLPLLAYNFYIFHNPLDFSFNYIDKNIYGIVVPAAKFSFSGMLQILPQLLVLSYRGLFFYYPILLFAIFGLCKIYHKYRNLVL